MERAAEGAPILTVRSRAGLRAWLAAHHGDRGPVWLASYRRHHPDHVPAAELVEELLCWGWIDSRPRALDADRRRVLIAPRSPKSARSAVNRAHVARARASGAMTPAGEAAIARAEANGMWAFLDDVEALAAPGDLLAALDAAGARAFWEGLPRSARRATLEWIKTARRPETRARRIDDVVQSARAGLRPTPFRRGMDAADRGP